MRVGQARKRDSNEKPIREALEAVGAEVFPISGKGAPDILVRLRGRLFGFEVKSKKGKRTNAQERTRWPVIRSVGEALMAVGISQ
jgi:hypothetical protein